MINLNNKIAVDTNIIIYAIENQDDEKRDIALDLLMQNPYISNHVLSEVIRVLRYKFKRNNVFCINAVLIILESCNLMHNTNEVYYATKFLIKRYKFSILDALVVAYALMENCKILYTEDMYEVIIEKKMEIVDPFKHLKND